MGRRANDKCKGCGASVIVVHLPNGVRLPVDSTPSPDGNICVVVDHTTGESTAWLARPEDKALTYRNHFATCAAAQRLHLGKEP